MTHSLRAEPTPSRMSHGPVMYRTAIDDNFTIARDGNLLPDSIIDTYAPDTPSIDAISLRDADTIKRDEFRRNHNETNQ